MGNPTYWQRPGRWPCRFAYGDFPAGRLGKRTACDRGRRRSHSGNFGMDDLADNRAYPACWAGI